ncbi:MAG: hypothetical protein KatS3mg054_0061 [Chloroflexus sp.]|nr:MAG: hypothetical protein KatS3mg054_0061 [Chloroflexus sp.]
MNVMKQVIKVVVMIVIAVWAESGYGQIASQPMAKLDSLIRVIESMDSTASVDQVRDVYQELKDVLVAIGTDAAHADKPLSKGGVKTWSEFIYALMQSLLSLLIAVTVFLFNYLRLPHDVVTNPLRSLLSKIRGRYIVIAVTVLVGIAGKLIFDSDDEWSWGSFLMYLFTLLLGGIGMNEVLGWVGVKLRLKKPEELAEERKK